MNDFYGILKKFAYDNHYESLTKALNSAYVSKESAQTMQQLTDHAEEAVAHGGSLIIHKGICYTTFVHNYASHSDDAFSKGLVLELAVFSLERALSADFDREKDIEVICFDTRKDIVGQYNFTSGLKCASMCLVGDDIYITLGGQVDNVKFSLFSVKYDTATGHITPAEPLQIRYKDQTMPFDSEAVNTIYVAEGYAPGKKEDNIETTGRWSEYKGEYYTAAPLNNSVNNCGLIIKTKDFKTVEFVSVVQDNNDGGGCEIATCIHTDQMYLACRQDLGIPYLRFMRYDLETGQWLESYKVEDGTSRPWFFIWKDEVYLYNTTEQTRRRYANLSQVRTDRRGSNHKAAPINTLATLFGCGSYHSFYVYEDRIFFVCSYMRHIHFGELKFKLFDTQKVNDKLLDLFGDC